MNESFRAGDRQPPSAPGTPGTPGTEYVAAAALLAARQQSVDLQAELECAKADLETAREHVAKLQQESANERARTEEQLKAEFSRREKALQDELEHYWRNALVAWAAQP